MQLRRGALRYRSQSEGAHCQFGALPAELVAGSLASR